MQVIGRAFIVTTKSTSSILIVSFTHSIHGMECTLREMLSKQIQSSARLRYQEEAPYHPH